MTIMTILAVREANQLIVLNKNACKNIALINFPIVKDRESFTQNSRALLHSIAASPAKYIEHAFEKAKHNNINPPYFLLNPLVEISDKNWFDLLDRLLEIDTSYYSLIATANDIPLGLFIPADQVKELSSRFLLRFLSFTSATLDFALLNKYFNQTQITHFVQEVDTEKIDQYQAYIRFS